MKYSFLYVMHLFHFISIINYYHHQSKNRQIPKKKHLGLHNHHKKYNLKNIVLIFTFFVNYDFNLGRQEKKWRQ